MYNKTKNTADIKNVYDDDELPLEQFGEVVNCTTRAKKDKMFLLSMTKQKGDEII